MRTFLSILLTAGAVLGIGGGLARLHHGGWHHRGHHRDRMMQRVAETCVQAARDLDEREHRHPPRQAAGAPSTPTFVPYPVAVPQWLQTAPMPVPAASPARPAAAPTAVAALPAPADAE